MELDLLLDIQRKVLGGYINAEEFSMNGSHKEILDITLNESLFDDFIHKAVARACNKLSDDDIPVTECTVLDFLQKHGLPKGVHQESEYLHLMTEFAITPRSFKQYISMILEHKMSE